MKKSIKTIGLVLGVALVASCSGMLDITPPNSITDEQVQDILANGTDDQKKLVMSSLVNPMINYMSVVNIPPAIPEALTYAATQTRVLNGAEVFRPMI